MKTAEEKYRSDPAYHNAVEMMRQILAAYLLTPGELREACLLAAYLHEATNPLPQFLREAELRRRLAEMATG